MYAAKSTTVIYGVSLWCFFTNCGSLSLQ